MSNKSDGGPAFPGDSHNGQVVPGNTSVSLRDWFAGQVAASYVARWGGMEGPALGGIAKRSYEMADAMLKARNE